MNKFILACAVVLSAMPHALACDICGCSSSGMQQGIMPGILHDFAGVRLQHRQFESTHPGLFGKPGIVSHEQFSTMEAWGRYSPHPRLQLMGFVPYNHFVKNEPGQPTEMVRGLGDVRLLANAVLINRNDTSGVAHLLLAGGGVKLPSGLNQGPTSAEPAYNPNMQAGTGSTDYMFMASYALRVRLFGLMAEANYTRNTANALGYRFGNRMAAAGHVFVRLSPKKAKWTAIPRVGYSWENAAIDYSDWDACAQNRYSGGTFGFANAALDVFAGRFAFNFNAALPAHQNFAMGRVQSNGRFGAGITFLFNSF